MTADRARPDQLGGVESGAVSAEEAGRAALAALLAVGEDLRVHVDALIESARKDVDHGRDRGNRDQ